MMRIMRFPFRPLIAGGAALALIGGLAAFLATSNNPKSTVKDGVNIAAAGGTVGVGKGGGGGQSTTIPLNAVKGGGGGGGGNSGGGGGNSGGGNGGGPIGVPPTTTHGVVIVNTPPPTTPTTTSVTQAPAPPPPPPGGATYKVVVGPTTQVVGQGPIARATTVSCPTGTTAVGGGGQIVSATAPNEAYRTFVAQTYPTPTTPGRHRLAGTPAGLTPAVTPTSTPWWTVLRCAPDSPIYS
jgi:hypothetical protein